MTIGLVMGLLKVALEVFKDERRDRFQKQFKKLELEYQNELAKDDDDISDLKLDTILFKCHQLAALIVAEHNKK